MSATLIDRPTDAPAVLPFVGVAGAPDEWLVRMVAQGDARAFEQIVLRYRDPLHRFCRGITGHPQDAEEALQTTMLRAYQALSTLERPVVLRPWLFRVARNVCIDIIRGRPDWATLTAGAEPAGDDPEDGHQMRERMRDLRRDLLNLDEPHRSALLLRELNGLSHKEIGDTLNTSPESAKRLIFEAREALLERNAGRDLDCTAVRECISGQDGRALRSRRMRTHLDECAACAAFRDGLRERPNRLAALFPALPAAGLARLWKGLASHGVISAGREAALVTGGGSGLLAGGGGAHSALILGALAVTGVIALPGMVASGDVLHGVTPAGSTMTLAGAPHHPPALPPVRRTTPIAPRITTARPVATRAVVMHASVVPPRPAAAPTVRVRTAPHSRPATTAPRATRVVVSTQHGRSVVPPRSLTPQAMSTAVDPPAESPPPTLVASAATAAAPVTTQPAPPVVSTPPDGTVASTPQGGGATAAGSPPGRPVSGGSSGQPGTPQTPTTPGTPKTTDPPPTKADGGGGGKGGVPPQKQPEPGDGCSAHHHRDRGDG